MTLRPTFFGANVKSVARRRLDVQSEANERRYPPLPPLSCWASSLDCEVRLDLPHGLEWGDISGGQIEVPSVLLEFENRGSSCDR